MKIINGKHISNDIIRRIRTLLYVGNMTIDEIIAWAAKFYPDLKLNYNDIVEINS